jgi:predicted nucleic acid-binding protein
MKIYLDTCCLNRPFDDQRQPRVRLESEAITLVLEKAHQHEWIWIGSDALIYEIEQNTDTERKERLTLLAKETSQTVEITEKVLEQSEKLESFGFDEFDAIHLASAEGANVDIFLTTDDNLLKVANRNKNLLSFTVINPVKWLEEVLK